MPRVLLCARERRSDGLARQIRDELGTEVIDSVPDAIDAIGAFQCMAPSHVVIDGEVDGSGGVRLASAMHSMRPVPTVVVVNPEMRNEVSGKLQQRSIESVRIACWGDGASPGRTPPLFAPRSIESAIPAPAVFPVVGAPGAFEAIVLLGSAGTPHMLPTLLPKLEAGGVPLVVAVHHNARLSSSFAEWVGNLVGADAEPLRCDIGSLPQLTVARATSDSSALQPDLDRVLLDVMMSKKRLLVIIASGMEFEGLHAVRLAVERGAELVALQPALCPQPAMVRRVLESGLQPRLCTHAEIAWLIQQATPTHDLFRRAC